MLKDFCEFFVECFIGIHTMGFEMISEYARDYRRWGLGYAIMDVVLGLLAIVTVLLADAFIIYFLYRLIRRISITARTKETKHYNVTGIVTDKSYVPAHTTYATISTGKSTMRVPQHHSEKYIVSAKYQDITEDFYGKLLYQHYNVDDSINLLLIHKLDKNNEIIEATLELPQH